MTPTPKKQRVVFLHLYNEVPQSTKKQDAFYIASSQTTDRPMLFMITMILNIYDNDDFKYLW